MAGLRRAMTVVPVSGGVTQQLQYGLGRVLAPRHADAILALAGDIGGDHGGRMGEAMGEAMGEGEGKLNSRQQAQIRAHLDVGAARAQIDEPRPADMVGPAGDAYRELDR